MTDRTERLLLASRREAHRRTRRLRERLFFIAQCGIAAGAAWVVAAHVLGHHVPFFAPVTAIICLGLSYGQRLRRVLELMVGVALGVLIGDLFVQGFGSGVWQLVVAVVVSMSAAALVGSGPLLSTQAGVQAAIVTTLVATPETAFSRWLDAVVGGSVALLAAVVAPSSPVRRPRREAAEAVGEIGDVLRDIVTGLRLPGEEGARASEAALERARATEEHFDGLRAAAAEGLAVARLSPLRRHHSSDLRAVLALVTPLDHCLRNLRVLARRAHAATWRDERVPTAYLRLLEAVADAADDLSRELHERAAPTLARAALYRVGELSAVVDPDAGLSAEVIRAQARSIIVDLLRLTGLTWDEAMEHLPETY